LHLPPNKSYIIKYTYLGYTDVFRNIDVKTDPLKLAPLMLRDDVKKLAEVTVEGVQTRGEQKGDTTQFNANAFKTHPDATAEDLIKKMPGVTSDNNGLTVNGETIKKVLVDGKPFFGDDPNAAIKNLPADIIDKIQIFDKASDQAQFTGFDDGNQQRTINIMTKKGRNVGQFGKIYAGYGTDNKYNAGATLNSFNNKQRFSVLLMSNNINQQNFSAADITGAMGNSGSSGGGGPRGGSGGGGGQSGAAALMTPQQNGISTTQAAGLNYSDSWGKKINVSGSYFFNYSDNKNSSDITRNYFTGNNLVYKQNSASDQKNQNQRLNFRFEYNIDSSNKLTIVPSLSFQDNRLTSALAGSNTDNDNVFLSRTNTNSTANNSGYDFNNNILYQHKFEKKGRTISFNLATQLSERNSDGTYNSANNYGDSILSGLNQKYTSYSDTKKISGSISYTEPLGKFSQMQINYSPSETQSLASKYTNDLDSASDQYTNFNLPLSNKYNNIYDVQRGGLSYKYRKDKMNLSLGSDVQSSALHGNEVFPVSYAINRPFMNILPNAFLNYRFSDSRNLNINYRSATNIPSVTQLQNVLDVSNPLMVKSGNADLKQTFENNLNIRIGGFDKKTSRNVFLLLNGNYTDNYVSNGTYILKKDSLLQGYRIKAGSQLTKPVNLNGYWTARSFLVYGFPVKAIKSNVNLNGGVTYNHTPTIINNALNFSNNYAFNGGAFIGSNISQNLDFSLSYSGSYNVVKNSLQKQSDNSYYMQTAVFRINWIFWKGFVLNTDFTNTLYNGLSQSYNQSYFLWNAYVGYKFLKSKTLEAKVSVFDLLNQNRSISRTITGTYTEDSYTTILKRYFMFTITYTIKHFKNGSKPPEPEQQQHQFPRGGFPPGGPPPGPPPGGGNN
ncbi:MAG: outer membrane beta-barrel protein, partial [Bacteroidia bacterium]